MRNLFDNISPYYLAATAAVSVLSYAAYRLHARYSQSADKLDSISSEVAPSSLTLVSPRSCQVLSNTMPSIDDLMKVATEMGIQRAVRIGQSSDMRLHFASGNEMTVRLPEAMMRHIMSAFSQSLVLPAHNDKHFFQKADPASELLSLMKLYELFADLGYEPKVKVDSAISSKKINKLLDYVADEVKTGKKDTTWYQRVYRFLGQVLNSISGSCSSVYQGLKSRISQLMESISKMFSSSATPTP